MAARYVPPNRRNTGEAREPRQVGALAQASTSEEKPINNSPKSYLVRDICNYFGDDNRSHRISSSTLHGSMASLETLAFVLLFHAANPRWPADRILFVKSNLQLLGTDTKSLDEDNAAPKLPESVAVFEQKKGSRMAKFEFTGWYKVTHVQFLEPRTTDLVRMLEQKWTQKDRYGNVSQIEREGEAWKRSLSQRWAIVKFDRNDVAEKEKGVLEIPEKSVNELLQEMRIRNITAAAAAEDTTTCSLSQNITSMTEQDPNISHAHSEDSQIPFAKDLSAAEPTNTVKGQNIPKIVPEADQNMSCIEGALYDGGEGDRL